MSNLIEEYRNGTKRPSVKLPEIQAGLSKKDIAVKADLFVAQAIEFGSVLQAVEGIAVLEEFVKQVRKDEAFVDCARVELSAYQNRFTTQYGAKIEACEAGTVYNYENCNDPVLAALESQLAELKEKVDKRRKLLQALPEQGEEIRYEDELIKIYKPYKTSVSTYRVILQK